jgi:tRNA threonylcarbamoyladenosine biosynthesis protein TsaE
VAYGRTHAATLRRGDVLALCGDLGAGKTHFVKGLAATLGTEAAVTSPTFTLIHEYVGGRIPLYHFDFYRLDDEDEALKIGLDEYLDGDGVCVIEWADKFKGLLPAHTQWFRFTHRADGARVIEHSA